MVNLHFRPEMLLRSCFRRGEELACFVPRGMQALWRGPEALWSLQKALVGFRNLSRGVHGRRLAPGLTRPRDERGLQEGAVPRPPQRRCTRFYAQASHEVISLN